MERTIEEILKGILSAVYGKDVRQDIHDGISMGYNISVVAKEAAAQAIVEAAEAVTKADAAAKNANAAASTANAAADAANNAAEKAEAAAAFEICSPEDIDNIIAGLFA